MLASSKKIALLLLALLILIPHAKAAIVKGSADIEVPYDSCKKHDYYKIEKEDELTYIYTKADGKQDTYSKIPIFPNGKSVIPLIGESQVEGKSVAEIKEQIQNKLGKTYEIEVFAFRKPDNISVLGEVKNPGSYQHDNIRTVYDAIAKAGGFTLVAKRTDVMLVRQRTDGTRVSYTINFPKEVFEAYEPGSGIGEDIYTLKEGDLIFIPTSRLKQLGRFGIKVLDIATLGVLTGVFTGIISGTIND